MSLVLMFCYLMEWHFESFQGHSWLQIKDLRAWKTIVLAAKMEGHNVGTRDSPSLIKHFDWVFLVGCFYVYACWNFHFLKWNWKHLQGLFCCLVSNLEAKEISLNWSLKILLVKLLQLVAFNFFFFLEFCYFFEFKKLISDLLCFSITSRLVNLHEGHVGLFAAYRTCIFWFGFIFWFYNLHKICYFNDTYI